MEDVLFVICIVLQLQQHQEATDHRCLGRKQNLTLALSSVEHVPWSTVSLHHMIEMHLNLR